MDEMQRTIATLRAVGEDTRLRILALVRRIELTVSDLMAILGQSQPRVSRHLKILTDAGLLERYREGAWVFYRPPSRTVADPAADAVAALVDELTASGAPQIARDLDRLGQIRAARAEAASAYFERNAADWDALRRLHLPEAEIEAAMRDMLGERSVGVFVDLGVGTGRMLEVFAHLYEEGVGYDLSRDMLTIARAKLEAAEIAHAQVRQGDILATPFPSEAADVVCIHQVLHFLDDPSAAIFEAARMTRSGGRVLVADFAPHEREDLREAHAHRRLGFSDQEMAAWTARAGLALCDTRTLAPQDETRDHLAVKLWLAKRPARGEERAEDAVGSSRRATAGAVQ